MLKCLIIDAMHQSIMGKLEEAGVEVHYQPEFDRQSLIETIQNFDILVVRSKTPIDREIIDLGIKLKVVARAGAGIDNLDLDYLESRNINVINAPEGNRDAVGDHTVGMVLVLLNKIHIADREVRQGLWRREANRGTELHNKTVGIIGYGNMGKAFASRVAGFGCEVIAFDKYKNDYSDQFARAASLDEVIARSDVLSLHVPLTDETEEMVNEEFIDRFPKPIYLINMARGEVVPMKSVVYGIEKGKIIGAGLDVLECEDLSKLNAEQKKYFDFLSKSDKVLFTPHIGGWSFESYQKISEVLAEKIIKEIG